MTYQYRAITDDGSKVQGTIDAPDEYVAMQRIKANYPVVVSIKESRGSTSLLSMELGKPKVNQKELAVMCSQFSIILNSGVPIDTCIALIGRQVKDKKLKKMLELSAVDVAKGNGIATSFEKHCSGLPATFVETVRAGEESGTIEKSFESLRKYYEKSYKTKQKVKQALSYPIFVFCVAIVVLIIVMATVIPSIAETFLDLGGDMPYITKFLIGTSEFFRENIISIVAVILIIAFAINMFLRTERGKIIWSKIKMKLPVIGNITILSISSQFANTMSALLTAGLSVSRALEVTGKVIDNYIISKSVSAMTTQIEEGRRLGECLSEAKLFPNTLVDMCAIGEETGELETTLETIGTYYDNEADVATTKAVQKIEPAILVFMAIFAGFIVMAIYMPMFTMYELI